MKLRYKILIGIMAGLAVCVSVLAIALSHDSACPSPSASAGAAPSMQAITRRCYGGPAALALEQIARPAAGERELVIRVRAAAVNPYDWHMLTGKPYVMRFMTGFGAPKYVQMGLDFAGVVDSVGKSVTRFKPGDEVFGVQGGALAQYLRIDADGALARKPPELTFEEAAAIPVAAVTALQALRDSGQLRAGQQVLINGASGGVGTYAVQLAKVLGAQVTGVCSARNLALVRGLGADHVIDYTTQDFTRRPERYHLIVDNVGNHSLEEMRKVLTPGGRVVIVTGPKHNPWIDPLGRMFAARIKSRFSDEKFVNFLSSPDPENLGYLAQLAHEGRLRSVIDRRYALSDTPAALEYLSHHHAQGKVVVDLP